MKILIKFKSVWGRFILETIEILFTFHPSKSLNFYCNESGIKICNGNINIAEAMQFKQESLVHSASIIKLFDDDNL